MCRIVDNRPAFLCRIVDNRPVFLWWIEDRSDFLRQTEDRPTFLCRIWDSSDFPHQTEDRPTFLCRIVDDRATCVEAPAAPVAPAVRSTGGRLGRENDAVSRKQRDQSLQEEQATPSLGNIRQLKMQILVPFLKDDAANMLEASNLKVKLGKTETKKILRFVRFTPGQNRYQNDTDPQHCLKGSYNIF